MQINTKHVKTEVLVENGGTVVIGGIYEQNDRTDITKVPFLGDLPVLGFLFKNTAHQRQARRSCWSSSRRASSTNGLTIRVNAVVRALGARTTAGTLRPFRSYNAGMKRAATSFWSA